MLSRITGYLRRRTIVVTDRRVQLMHEILAAIKLIKQYAWEATFVKRITGECGFVTWTVGAVRGCSIAGDFSPAAIEGLQRLQSPSVAYVGTAVL